MMSEGDACCILGRYEKMLKPLFNFPFLFCHYMNLHKFFSYDDDFRSVGNVILSNTA